MVPDATTTVRPPLPIDVRLSLAPLRHGPRDPCILFEPGQVWRATRTPDGPATACYEQREGGVVVRAWGPGAERLVAEAPLVLGARDNLEGWAPKGLVRQLDRRFPGLRVIFTKAVLEALVPAVLEQRVASVEAHWAWQRLVRAWGEEAPGPRPLLLPPRPEVLAGRPYWAYHPLGVERRRADVVRRAAARAPRLETVRSRPPLETLPGIGSWTSAHVAFVAWGDADAVPTGDYHLPSIVVYALTGHRGGDDDAMLELLEPFRPHRGRAARLLALAGPRPARRHPRAPLRDFARL